MNAVSITLWFILCIVAQVLLFNHLSVFGGVILFYLYLFVKMPVELNRSLQIFLGFLLGLTIDIFSNTPGMHALAGTTIMWARLPILHLYVVADDFKTGNPGRKTMGQSMFLRFCISIVVCHTILLYLFEAFTSFNFFHMLVKIVITAILTTITFLAIEEFNNRKHSDS